MKEKVQEEFLTLFSIALVSIAVSTMLYMSRTPSITGDAVLDGFDSTTTIIVVALLILAGLAVVLGAIIAVLKLKKEVKEHKDAIGENKTTLIDKPENDLMSYILNAKDKGFTDEQIVSRLKNLGWNPKDISRHMDSFKNQNS